MELISSPFAPTLRDIDRALVLELSSRAVQEVRIVAHRSLPPDRWLLSSSLQKCIRRGLCEDATDVAIVLHSVDVEYAWRRLRTIALEDVGLGDMKTVATVLAIAGKRQVRNVLGDLHLFVSLVLRLAVSKKDRTACDLLCWTELSPEVSRCRAQLIEASASWESMTLDQGLPIWQRVVALQLLAGLTIRTPKGYRAISKSNTAALWRVVEALRLDPLVAFAVLKGTGTESLNLALPFAQHLREEAAVRPMRECATDLQSPARIGGFIAPSFCMHTRTGLRALRLFLSRDMEFRELLIRAGAINAVRASGFLLFEIESGLLDHYEDYAPVVRMEAERAELAHYGIIHDADAAALRMALKTRQPALNDARRSAWAEYEAEAGA